MPRKIKMIIPLLLVVMLTGLFGIPALADGLQITSQENAITIQ